MKVLYLDCSMGAAGDMLAGALWELVENKSEILKKIQSIVIPNVDISFDNSSKCGIKGSKFNVNVDGTQENPYNYEPLKSIGDILKQINVDETIKNIGKTVDEILGKLDTFTSQNESNFGNAYRDNNENEHNHHSNSYSKIKEYIATMNISERVRHDILEVYAIIADAESKAHGVEIENVHFHELGTIDAIVDIATVCILIEQINPDKIIASPVNLGGGFVKCEHGVMQVPAPATANILIGVPCYSGEIKSELCTPTGAALLKYFVNSFENMPKIKINKIGYGMGTKDFHIANCLRAILGSQDTVESQEMVYELSCNIDDISAEQIAFALDRLRLEGALDVYTQPIYMKKNRPGTMITALCLEQNKNKLIEIFFKHTSTLAVRERALVRHKLHRKTLELDTPYGKIHKKISWGYGVERDKYEYDDIARIAIQNNKSIYEIERELEND